MNDSNFLIYEIKELLFEKGNSLLKLKTATFT